MSKQMLTSASTAIRLALAIVIALSASLASRALAEETVRVSSTHAGGEANDNNLIPTASTSGKRLAFASEATNLVPGDVNTRRDVFVRDREAGTTVLASVDSFGVQSNQDCDNPAISADGRFVAFDSTASNLVAGDTNTVRDVFLRDLQTGTTTRASVDSAGAQRDRTSSNPALSADGRFVAFQANRAAGRSDILVYDRNSGVSTLVSTSTSGVVGNHDAENPVLSPDGRFVAFESSATNLVPNDTNNDVDVFVVDRDVDEDQVFDEPGAILTVRASVSSAGAQANGSSRWPAISADGRHVVFSSVATNLVAGDGNNARDVLARDLQSATTVRLSVNGFGAEGNFESTTPSVSNDGRMVVFQSASTNLVDGDANGARDVFLHDRDTDNDQIFDEALHVLLARASVSTAGVEGNGDSGTMLRPVVTAGGSFAVFESVATNLVAADANGKRDVFLRELTACGNGIVTPDEVCDDSNQTSGDGCDANCTPTACGNAVTSPGELCDDGDQVSGDGCDSNCTPTACGNGIETDGETCDDGDLVDGDGCDSNCTPTGCGNEITTDGEECDDGNGVDGDACRNDCSLNVCGDGSLNVGFEACDDGNLDNGDGCDANCTPTGCGNGVLSVGEGCDDANIVDGDGCDSNCTPTACGNGIVANEEECDDANLLDGDGCDSNCTATACGNGVLTAGEVCDDENLVDDDGCDSNCTPTACGNGVVTSGETCDDQNLLDGDGCDSNCTPTACGNGIVTTGEVCDDGNLVSSDACKSDCTPNVCGDGVVRTGVEVCDSGAAVGLDHCCSATCTVVDFDGDTFCDAIDLADLSGLVVKKLKVKESISDDDEPDGSLSWSGDATVGAPYGGSGAFLAQAKLAGFTVHAFATSSPPLASDEPILTYGFAASDCLFVGLPEPIRAICKKNLPDPPGSRLKLTVRRASNGVLKIASTAKSVDVTVPPAGPGRVVITANDPGLLDFEDSLAACTAKAGKRPLLRCK